MEAEDSYEKEINNTKVNQFGGYYVKGKRYSAAKVAECVDVCFECGAKKRAMSSNKVGQKAPVWAALSNCQSHIF